MAEIHEEERAALHWMEELAKLLGGDEWPGLAEWQRLSYLPPPKVNNDKLWRP